MRDLSKATVVSICPFPIKEFKPGLIPNTFEIKAAANDDLELLVIDNNIFHRQRVPVLGNTLTIPVPAHQVAESIVKDRESGQISYSANAKPGLFWVPGNYTKDEAKIELKDLISSAKVLQHNWFIELVKSADDDWNQYHRHNVITDMQRHAATILNVVKDWNIKIAPTVFAEQKLCVACYTPIHPNAAICATCRTNQAEFLASLAPVISEPIGAVVSKVPIKIGAENQNRK